MSSRIVARRKVERIKVGHSRSTRPDRIAVEEPLEIRVNGDSLVVTMRTPGSDIELANGFLVAEGVIDQADDVARAAYCAGDTESDGNTYNVLDLSLAPGVHAPREHAHHRHLATSACGVCGKSSIDAVRVESHWELSSDLFVVEEGWIASLPERLRAEQRVFEQTGGLHAAALVSANADDFLVVREDVGRHNAVDKAVGWALMHRGLPLRGTVLVVSGRASFELTQKAALAGISMLVAVSAPSSLAVELAHELGMTLAGFTHEQGFVLYAGAHRVASPRSASR